MEEAKLPRSRGITRPQQQKQHHQVGIDEIHHIIEDGSSSSSSAAAATGLSVSCFSSTPSSSMRRSGAKTTLLIPSSSNKRFGGIIKKVDCYAPASELCSDKVNGDTAEMELNGNEEVAAQEKTEEESTPSEAILSERRKALFEPLEPNMNGKRPTNESLLPPPDFDSASYPKGWLIGKKRKLVNVDVVESMRRIAVQEMNRKDREIDGLNEQLEGDAKVLEHLQIQLLEEKSKRTSVERENAMLQDHINMLMDMLQENERVADDGTDEP